MRWATKTIALMVALGSSPALAENWVTVFDSEPFSASVDKDSIRRGSDNLVYFTSNGAGGKTDNAADCQRRLTYTLKLYVHGGLNYPNWRDEGRAVVVDSIGDAILTYACANS